MLLGIPGPRQIVFTHNCTDSLNTAIQGLLRSGDHVIASTLDHNSVLRPLHALKQSRGVTYQLVDFSPETGVVCLEQLESLLDANPVRLVIISHASNVTGTIQPLDDIMHLAHAAGALVLVDAAQTAGYIPINFSESRMDLLAMAGHKGLMGPLGTGVLCIRPGLESTLEPLRFGGTGTNSEQLEQPSEMPSRFESGNLNLPGLAGLDAALTWLTELPDPSLPQQRIRELYDGLREIRSVNMLTPSAENNVGIVSFNIEGVDCRDVAVILDQSFGILSRAGFHCAPLAHQTLRTLECGGAVRLSPGRQTTSHEIQHVINAVSEIAAKS